MNQSKSETGLPPEGIIEAKGGIAILGIGGAGVKMASAILSAGPSPRMRLGALDFDEGSLASYKGDCKLSSPPPAGTKAMGTGGDILVGERLAAMSRAGIAQFISGAAVLIGLSGMGGGTGTAASPIVARVAKKLGVPTIFILTVPFSFEGHKRRQTAEKGIENLLVDADVVVPIDNDILYSIMPSETPFPEAFLRSDAEIAMSALCIGELLTAESYLSSTFPSLKNMLGRRKSSCSIGSGEAEMGGGKDFCQAAAERLLDSPLLGGLAEMKKADAAAISISGGCGLGIGPMKRTFETVKTFFRDDAELVCSVSDNGPQGKGVFRITVLAARYESQKPESDSKASGAEEARQGGYMQDELPLMTPKKGIFVNTSENFFKSQDLDIPTFQRKGLSVDFGK